MNNLGNKCARALLASFAVFLAASLSACATTKPGLEAGLAAAGAPASTAMALGAPVTAPEGFLNLCMRSPTDCAAEDSFAERIRVVAEARELSRQRWNRVFAEYRARLGKPADGVELAEAVAPTGVADLSLARPASIGAPAEAAEAAPALALVWLAPVVQDAPLAPEAPSFAVAADAAAVDVVAVGPAPLALDASTWATLKTVNREVNRKIRKASDRDAFGVEDWWAAPLAQGLKAQGDCEDYVLEKRRELIAAGLPARALSIALVRTSWGEPHAVLLVATGQGDYVLDNLSAEVKPWREVDYVWTARQSPTDLMTWLAPATA